MKINATVSGPQPVAVQPEDEPKNLLQLLAKNEGPSRDIWDSLKQYLSTNDLASLGAVSPRLRECVARELNKINEREMEIIRSAENKDIVPGSLRDVTISRNANQLVEQGYDAAACCLSRYDALQGWKEGNFSEREHVFPEVQGNSWIDRMRADGTVIVFTFNSGNGGDNNCYATKGEHIFMPAPSTTGLTRCLTGANTSEFCCAKESIEPTLTELVHDSQGRMQLHFSLDNKPPVSLPLTINLAQRQLINISSNSRFVAILEANHGNDSYDLKRYDRDKDLLWEVNIADPDIISLSVADDGALFVGSHAEGHIFKSDETTETIPYGNSLNSTFMLSPDGQFLIRNSPGEESSLILKDLKNDREILLQRTNGPVSEANSTYIELPFSVAFSPLNALVAVSYKNGSVQLFDLSDTRVNNAPLLMETYFHQKSQVSFSKGFDQFHITAVEQNNLGLKVKTVFLNDFV